MYILLLLLFCANITYGQTAWDTTTAVHEYTLDVSAKVTSLEALFVHPDGTGLWVGDNSDKNVEYYTMSTPYDLSTATWDSASNYSGTISTLTGISFNSDGTWFFLSDSGADDLNQWYCYTPYDLSTAEFRGVQTISANNSAPWSVQVIKNDTFFKVGQYASTVEEWAASNPNSVTTITFVQEQNFTTKSSLSTDSWIKQTDGTNLYHMTEESRDLYDFELTTAYDISSASNVAITTLTELPTSGISSEAISFTSNGGHFYIAQNTTNDTIYHYSIELPPDIPVDPATINHSTFFGMPF